MRDALSAESQAKTWAQMPPTPRTALVRSHSLELMFHTQIFGMSNSWFE